MDMRDKDHAAILVTGAVGYIGQTLLRVLSTAGETVVAMYRHRLPEPMENVFPVCSNMSSAPLLAAPLRGVKTVVHLAWERSFKGPECPQSDSLDFNSPNLSRMDHLIQAMEKAGSQRLIFVSANGADGNSSHPFLKEKYSAELMVVNSKIPEKVIIRPSVVCGGSLGTDRFLRSITRMMKFPGFYPVPTKNVTLAPLDLNDLVHFIHDFCVQSIDQPVTLASLEGSAQYSTDELFKLVSDKYLKGSRFPVRHLLGDSLVALLERERKGQSLSTPCIKDFLVLGSAKAKKIHFSESLQMQPGFKPVSFSDILSEYSEKN